MVNKRMLARMLFLPLILCLAVACTSPTLVPTPTFQPVPTPKVDFQIVGTTRYNYMVVVDPASSTDRAGLQSVGDYLCDRTSTCIVWFWDDVARADTSYPIDPAAQEAMIATFTYNWVAADTTLVIYALGDE